MVVGPDARDVGTAAEELSVDSVDCGDNKMVVSLPTPGLRAEPVQPLKVTAAHVATSNERISWRERWERIVMEARDGQSCWC
jgi:hypothetical protein